MAQNNAARRAARNNAKRVMKGLPPIARVVPVKAPPPPYKKASTAPVGGGDFLPATQVLWVRDDPAHPIRVTSKEWGANVFHTDYTYEGWLLQSQSPNCVHTNGRWELYKLGNGQREQIAHGSFYVSSQEDARWVMNDWGELRIPRPQLAA